MATTTQACALLRTERLTFTVLDFQEENASIGDADDASSVLARCLCRCCRMASPCSRRLPYLMTYGPGGRHAPSLCPVEARVQASADAGRLGSGREGGELVFGAVSPRRTARSTTCRSCTPWTRHLRVDAARQELVQFVEKGAQETGCFRERHPRVHRCGGPLGGRSRGRADKPWAVNRRPTSCVRFYGMLARPIRDGSDLEELLQECRRAPPAEAICQNEDEGPG